MSTTLRVSNLPDERRAILHGFGFAPVVPEMPDIEHQMKLNAGVVDIAGQLADLWFISHRMANAVEVAASTIPDGSTLDWHMIPGQTETHHRMVGAEGKQESIGFNTPGIVFFERPIAFVEIGDNKGLPLDALMWVPFRTNPRALRILALARNDSEFVENAGLAWKRPGLAAWSIILPSEETLPDDTLTGSDFLRFLVAMWALSETRVAAPTHVHPSRASRKRSARQDIDEPAIKVMRLRRVEQSHHHHDPDSDHDTYRYSKRWVVSGHWRQQPYGPERLLRKPVYIEPHIKGPAWAPLDDREVIKAMVR